jgi:hypothetical protein
MTDFSLDNPSPLVREARERSQRHMDIASGSYVKYSDEWFAEYNLQNLQHLADHGLATCYNGSMRDYLFDFYADFSWNGRMCLQAQIMLNDERLPKIAADIAARYDFDFVAELTKAASYTAESDLE